MGPGGLVWEKVRGAEVIVGDLSGREGLVFPTNPCSQDWGLCPEANHYLWPCVADHGGS